MINGASEKTPLFSIVTVVYNGEDYLERTIRSVAEQSERDFEYIIVDGGSNDRTLEIIKEHSSLVDLWISEPDEGMYDAINKGLALSRGRYIKILNADDLLPRDSMVHARKAFEEHGDRVLVRSDLEVIDEDGKVIERMGTARMIRFYPVFLHPSWYLPLNVYEEIGVYATRYACGADSEYAMRLAQHGVRVVHLDRILAQFRTGGMSQGYRGIAEGFDIHRRYIGDSRAAYIAAAMLYKKLRFNALAAVVGERRAHRIRVWLKSRLIDVRRVR